MKKILYTIILGFVAITFTACSNNNATNTSNNEVQQRAIYSVDRLYINDELQNDLPSDIPADFIGSQLTFVGELQGGSVLIQVGDTVITASTNPSEDHPSFADGIWHHHLYAGSTQQGSPRINFMELLPHLGIDDNPEATDNTQSSYQRGNLHYIVADNEYRLRFTIGGNVHDLMFVPN